MPQRRAEPAAGFTLIEMLIVVAIMGILAAIAIPSARTVLQVYRLDTSAAMLRARLAGARAQALARNRPVWLAVDAASGLVQARTFGAGRAPVAVDGPGLLGPGVTVDTTRVTFDALGRPAAGALDLTLQTTSGHRRVVHVAASGLVVAP